MAKLFEPARSWLSSESLSNFVSTHHHEIVALQKDASVADALKVRGSAAVMGQEQVQQDRQMGTGRIGWTQAVVRK